MLDLLKAELDSKKALVGPLPPIINKIVETIPAPTIPTRMKQVIAVSEIMLYASQFRRNIHHWDGSPVPINTIGTIVTGSGQGKDSSVNAARKCFKPGYTLINDKRDQQARRRAINEALEAGEESPTQWEGYKDYYREPNPLFSAPSTTEGFIQHLNDLEQDGLGSGYLYTGEIGAELAQNPLMVENIKVLSELYDLGNKEVKLLKARENQSKEITGLPVSALFVGSPSNILYEESIKKKFRVEFSSKLARRSWFVFCPESIPEKEFTGPSAITDMIDYEEDLENQGLTARENVADGIKIITNDNLNKTGRMLEVAPEVRKLFLVYKRYNAEMATTIPKLYPMSELVRRHLQWKALKLSGAIAIFNQHDTITEQDYIEAIRFCELLDSDMAAFEAELVKEPYEVFADQMKFLSKDGKSSMGLHNLRKMKFIPTAGDPNKKMKELIHLANAYDKEAIYSIDDTNIKYEAIIKTDVLGISFKPIDNSGVFAAIESGADLDTISKQKALVASTTAYGLDVADTTFSALSDLLEGDFAYSPFRFKDGVRGKENIIGGTKWLVLDVDDSAISAEECHFMLSDINHHIALTSDATNQFKFRVLIELDSFVDENHIVWKNFFLAVAEELALKVDPLPQSQIFFSYSGRPVLSVLDAQPLPVRDYLVQAIEKSEDAPTPPRALPIAHKQALLADELTTFSYCFECPFDGGGSRSMIRMAYHAKDLGMNNQEIIELVHRANDYWVSPLPEDRLETTVLSQIRRW